MPNNLSLGRELPYSIEMDIKRLKNSRTLSDLFTNVWNLQIVIMNHGALDSQEQMTLLLWLSNITFTLDKENFE